MNANPDLEEMTFDELDALRRKALFEGDAVTYARIVNQLGIEPENVESLELYERGSGEATIEQRLELSGEIVQRMAHNDLVRRFMRDAVTVDISRLIESTARKRDILITYFPEKFADDGTQSVKDYSPGKIGALFKGVYEGYLRYLRAEKESTEEQKQGQ